MENELTPQDKQRIEESIRGKYLRAAASPEGLFRYPTGRAGLEALGYDPDMVRDLPEPVAASYCGVGNPFTLGPIRQGEAVLDIGCGAGVDSILAARLVGPSGSVTAIDLVSEMLDRAQDNARMAGAANITFREASAEELPFPDASFDVVISNGVLNLVVDKVKALSEIYRVLKPGGRFLLADQVLAGELPKELKARIENWARWEGGAIPGKVFLALLQQAGFEEAELVTETGFNSSPMTKGVLFRAVKPVAAMVGKQRPASQVARQEGEMEYLLKRALELGAEKAKLIDTETVVTAEWVRWKYQYDRPLFEKDPSHPPLAPDVAGTKKVLGEYTKAILLNGPNGQTLSEAAVILEGEAYRRGYYKAFALTPLMPSGGVACAPPDPGSNPNSGGTWPTRETQAPVEPARVEEVKPTALSPSPSPGGCWPSGQTGAPGEPLKAEEIQPDLCCPGGTWPPGAAEAQAGPQRGGLTKFQIRPMMEACGIDVFKTARHNGFDIDTRKETYGRWNFFALLLVE